MPEVAKVVLTEDEARWLDQLFSARIDVNNFHIVSHPGLSKRQEETINLDTKTTETIRAKIRSNFKEYFDRSRSS